MNKAVISVFADNGSASRSINDLKAYGFGGETITQIMREDLARGERLPGPMPQPAMEILKGLVIGAVGGAVLGALAYYLLAVTVAIGTLGVTSPLYATVLAFALVGAICGILEGLAAIGPLASARKAMMMRQRGDALVTVDTDETHAGRAADILRTAGAVDVRRGACSVPDEFRTSESVRPETYGTTPIVQREPVEAPAATGDVTQTPPAGGAVG